MGKKKRHHYLPQFYLREFSDSGRKPTVWQYEKGKEGIIRVSVRDAAVRKHYHSFTTREGTWDSETFENALSVAEGDAARVCKRIKEYASLSEEDRRVFGLFLSLMISRVPHFRTDQARMFVGLVKKVAQITAYNPEAFRYTIDAMAQDQETKANLSAEELEDLRQLLMDGDYEVTPSEQFSLQFVTVSLAPVLEAMRWFFLVTDDEHQFCTSDNPVCYVDPNHDPRSLWGEGLGNRDIEVTFPITRHIAFLALWREDLRDGYFPCPPHMVESIRSRTVWSASRFVYASQRSRELHSLVQEHAESSGHVSRVF